MTIKSTVEAALAEVKEWSAYRLANEADCPSPDNLESEGAGFLTRVRSDTVEMIEYNIDDIEGPDWFDSVNDDGKVNEIADSAPSIYTYTKWQQFVDLGAWQEDPSELGFDGTDMDRVGSVCLYMIAERLANAILFHVREAVENADGEGQEDD